MAATPPEVSNGDEKTLFPPGAGVEIPGEDSLRPMDSGIPGIPVTPRENPHGPAGLGIYRIYLIYRRPESVFNDRERLICRGSVRGNHGRPGKG